MSSDIAVSVEDVSKRYDLYVKPSDQLKQYLLPRLRRAVGMQSRTYFHEFWALRNVSLEVRKGEPFGIVGRNGSGKSTLLQIITGVLTPTSGVVRTEGRVAALLELGSGFNPEFTGRENVFLNAALLGFSREEVERRFDAIAAFADIGEHLEQPLKTYSSGMVVRLAVAVQTQVEPDILVIDEALAVGDALFQKRCYRQINRLLDNGCALLFVSHEQEVVRSLTRRAVFLKDGQVQASGPSADVVFAYREYLQKEEEAAFQASRSAAGGVVQAAPAPNSFGNFDVQIVSVQVLDASGTPTESLRVGEEMRIAVHCVSNVDTENLNIAFRIRTKEGIKVITWGTLNEDMPLFAHAPEQTFWSRRFRAGEQFTVEFSGTCRLAGNFYEVEAVVAREYDQFYREQRILHWIDEAAHFSVSLREREYVFDGIADLCLRSRRSASAPPTRLEPAAESEADLS